MVTIKLEKSFKTLRGKLNNEYRQQVLTAVYEGVAEQVWGRTHALSANKYHHDTMARGRAAWQPVFHNVPLQALQLWRQRLPRHTHSQC